MPVYVARNVADVEQSYLLWIERGWVEQPGEYQYHSYMTVNLFPTEDGVVSGDALGTSISTDGYSNWPTDPMGELPEWSSVTATITKSGGTDSWSFTAGATTRTGSNDTRNASASDGARNINVSVPSGPIFDFEQTPGQEEENTGIMTW